MQSGSLFFQSLPDELSLISKKELVETGCHSRPAENSALAEESFFLSTLKQVAKHPQRPTLISVLSQAQNADSKTTIQDLSDDQREWFHLFLNGTLGLQHRADKTGPGSQDVNAWGLPLSLLKDFDAVARETYGNSPFWNSVSEPTDSGGGGEAPFYQWKQPIQDIPNGTQDIQVTDASIRLPTQRQASDTDATRLFSVLDNIILEFLKTNPNLQPSDPLIKTDPANSDGFNKQNQLYTLISDLLHWRETAGSMPLAAMPGNSTRFADSSINPQGPDFGHGREAQTLLVKLLSYLHGRAIGIANQISESTDRSIGAQHPADLAPEPAKTKTGFQMSVSTADNIIPDLNNRHRLRDHTTRLGLDFLQRMDVASNGKIVTGKKDLATSHLKATVTFPPVSNSNQPSDNPAGKNIDLKAALPRGTAAVSSVSDIGTLSSEAEKESQDLKNSGPRIPIADGIAREESGDRASRVIPQNGDKAFLFSNNRISENISESASSAKDPDPVNNLSQRGALNQIVEKAALNFKNGQAELRLNLKPDFLGQVHMRIVTENHMVTLKISTEFLAVKDFIENNIHQLKADLQNHGLEINAQCTRASCRHSGKIINGVIATVFFTSLSFGYAGPLSLLLCGLGVAVRFQ